MLAGALALASVVHLAASARTTFQVGERTEGRMLDDGKYQYYEVEMLPGARLQIEDGRRWTYFLGYQCRIIFNGLERVPREGPDPLVPDTLNIGVASVTWKASRTAKLELREDATFGDLNFTSIYSNPTQPIAAQPNAPPASLQSGALGQKITFLSSNTSLISTVAPSRRWLLTTGLSYLGSGGVEAGAQIYLPFQKGPRLSEEYAYALSRRSALLGNLFLQRSDFTNGFREDVIFEQQGFGLRGRYWEARGQVGAALVRRREGATAPTSSVPFPAAEASFGVSYGRKLRHFDARILGRLGPVIQQLDGTVDERLQGFFDASFLWNPVGIRGQFGVAQSLPYDDPTSAFILNWTGAAFYNLTKKTSIEAGYRYLYQLLYSDLVLEKPVQVVFVAFATSTPVLPL